MEKRTGQQYNKQHDKLAMMMTRKKKKGAIVLNYIRYRDSSIVFRLR